MAQGAVCEEDVTLELCSGKSFPEAHSGARGVAVTQKALSFTVSILPNKQVNMTPVPVLLIKKHQKYAQRRNKLLRHQKKHTSVWDTFTACHSPT